MFRNNDKKMLTLEDYRNLPEHHIDSFNQIL